MSASGPPPAARASDDDEDDRLVTIDNVEDDDDEDDGRPNDGRRVVLRIDERCRTLTQCTSAILFCWMMTDGAKALVVIVVLVEAIDNSDDSTTAWTLGLNLIVELWIVTRRAAAWVGSAWM